VPYFEDDMVHIHNAYPVPQFTPSQLETLTAICDTLFQAHTGEEAAAIKARLPSDCPDWQKEKGRSRLRKSMVQIKVDIQSMLILHSPTLRDQEPSTHWFI
jgi:hypothetical protein